MTSLSTSEFQKAVQLLQQGEVVAAPTDTVYGLFGDATSDSAIQKIYHVKGRPSCNPLIIHVNSIEMAQRYAEISPENLAILEKFWGKEHLPITFVLPLKLPSVISPLVTAGLSTIAVRFPNHPLTLQLIEEVGKPLAAPSANTSMCLSPTSAVMVQQDLGKKIPLILEGGSCSVGIESTILDLSTNPAVILRQGGLSQEDVERILGATVLENQNETCIKAPGMMKRHYAPQKPLRINAAYPLKGEAFIAFGKTPLPHEFNLSPSGNLREAAQKLFSMLKSVDARPEFSGIAMMPIPQVGLGRGINDRLRRAAQKKSPGNHSEG